MFIVNIVMFAEESFFCSRMYTVKPVLFYDQRLQEEINQDRENHNKKTFSTG
ncbi:hypothetical protein OKW24_002646 [Peribacillus simplex]|nr:hypothetical protein [Peribacillus simplex]